MVGRNKQLMSFQSYVRALSNDVDENTAYKKYKDFMADLSQSKVGRFFDANKDREWFKLRYHPIDSQKVLQQQNLNFLKRLKIFNTLMDAGHINRVSLSIDDKTAVLNMMDAIIVQLEDGPQELVDQLLSASDTCSQVDEDLRRKYIPDKSTSVAIDDISIDTTIAEMEEVCKNAHPDLIRIASLDPYYVEEGQLRRKVVAIYRDTVDIRDVCWKLSRMKLNNRSISVFINKCLTNRIQVVNALASNNTCIINDIRIAIILILNFDELKGLYGKRKQLLENTTQQIGKLENGSDIKVKIKTEPTEKSGDVPDNIAPLSPPGSEKSANDDDNDKPFDVATLDEDKEKEKRKLFEFKFNVDPSPYKLVSKLKKSSNPILENAHIYFVDYSESTAAKYYLSKVPQELIENKNDADFAIDDCDRFSVVYKVANNIPFGPEENTRYLDKLLWYLRIVHSFDYYKKAFYRQEDELTLKMSVIHLRDSWENVSPDTDSDAVESYLQKCLREFEEFGESQVQKFVTKDEERFNYKSYGKMITDELTSYAQRIQKPKSNETEEVYKCKHCTRVFQKLSDIGRHFVSKHRWAVDAIELETDFFNSYLFDPNKIDPCPPRELLELPPNRFAKMNNQISQMGEDPDLLQQTIEAYKNMEDFVREPAPRMQTDSDPRNDSIVDYNDISFDDAI